MVRIKTIKTFTNFVSKKSLEKFSAIMKHIFAKVIKSRWNTEAQPFKDNRIFLYKIIIFCLFEEYIHGCRGKSGLWGFSGIEGTLEVFS